MAVVTTHHVNEYLYRASPLPLAPGIDEIGKVGADREHYESLPVGDVSVTSNIPIGALENVVTTVSKVPSFADDYYDRIHVNPSLIDLGNLLSAQSREVEVWNAYQTSKLLSSVSSSGSTGITLTEPEAAPTTFQGLESRVYGVSISTNGSPVINTTYTFAFPGESPTLRLTGRRVVVWPFIPQTLHSEKMEWLTDVIPSYTAEQRAALRSAPRQYFNYRFQLSQSQLSRMKAITNQWSHRVYGIPVWSEMTYLGPLTSGATAILFDTSYADYRADDVILIWESDTNFIALESVEVLSDRVTLKLPLTRDFQNAYVMPLRFSRTPKGVSYNRGPNEYSVVNGEFQVTSNKDLGASLGWDTYRGAEVVPSPTIMVSNITDRIFRGQDVFDNGSGPIEVEVQSDWVGFSQQISFDTLTRQERWEARQWIHSRRGKQKSFWLPSWNVDLISLVDISSASTALTVSPIGYPLYYEVKDIRIELLNGTVLYNRITGGTTDGDGNEILVLENPPGVELLANEINYICFMSHVRFNSDSITLSHKHTGRASCSIPVIEIPE